MSERDQYWLQGLSGQQLGQQALAQQQGQYQDVQFQWIARVCWPKQIARWRERQGAGFNRGELSLPEEPQGET